MLFSEIALLYYEMNQEGGAHMQVNKKKEYTKPIILAATKKNANFSAGCPTKYGTSCATCRCS